MIDLVASDDRAGFGVACALDIERIPYRRLARAEDFDARLLLVAGHDVPSGIPALARRVPTLVIGAPAALTSALFAAPASEPSVGPVTIGLGEPIWPSAVRAQARRFGKSALRLPWAPVVSPGPGPAGEPLAALRRADGASQPAIVRRESALWCLVDLGTALSTLLDESYLPGGSAPARPMPRWLLESYYRAPERLRNLYQRRIYARLERSLQGMEGASDYPVDATGWLVVELVKELVRRAAGGLVRLARWPAPHTAAASLTHDLEPSRFSYTRGLEELTRRVRASAYPATFGVVARPAARHLGTSAREGLRRHEVICHGLEHRGETLLGSRKDVARGVGLARLELEATLGRPVTGFRSPRLDRSRDLIWALDQAGFRCDSSYPDVDRENVARYGGGVRLNVPFRQPISDREGRVRQSRCLQVPVSAPDCIQPLFAGEDVESLRRAVSEKIDFVQATGGLYVGIVHAGVFGRRDAARRGEHLAFVRGQLDRRGLWLANVREVSEWWQVREHVAVSVRDGRIHVTNEGERTAAGVRVVVERGGAEDVLDVPDLLPGESTMLPLGLAGSSVPRAGSPALD